MKADGWQILDRTVHNDRVARNPAREATAVLTGDYSAVELTVRAGQEVVVDEERAGWLRVRTDAGERGWILRAAVSP